MKSAPSTEHAAMTTGRQSDLISFKSKVCVAPKPSRIVRNTAGLQLTVVTHCAKIAIILG